MSRFRKYFSLAFLGMTLILSSGILKAQMVPPLYQPWTQYTFPYFGPTPADLFSGLGWMQQQLYNMRRQLQSYSPHNASYFGAMPPWGGNFTGSGSASNLQDMGDHYLVQMRLPGATSKDINMRLDGQVLSISLQTGSQGTETNLNQWQTFFGMQQQFLTFPEAVDNNRIRGQFRDGLLTMIVPKIARMGN